MPRRPATVERDITLFLIPHIVQRGVRTHGEELERVIVRRASFHFYNVSIRSRPIKRELKGVRKVTLRIPEADTWEDGEDRVEREDMVSRKSWENTNGREVRVDIREQGSQGKNREGVENRKNGGERI